MRTRSLMTSTFVLLLSLCLLWGCQQPASDESAGETGPAGTEPQAGVQGGTAPASTVAHGEAPNNPPPAPRTLTVPAGTVLTVRTTNALSTKSVQPGETFTASLEEALVSDGRVVAEKGARVYGKVANADPGGRVKGVASLSVRLSEIEAANGDRLSIATNTYGVEAQTTKKKDATKVGIASGVGAAIGAITGGGSGAAKGAGIGGAAGTGVVLATRGDPAVIPSESVLSFKLSESLTVH